MHYKCITVRRLENISKFIVLKGMNPCILKISCTQKATNIQFYSKVLFKASCPTASMQILIVHAVSYLSSARAICGKVKVSLIFVEMSFWQQPPHLKTTVYILQLYSGCPDSSGCCVSTIQRTTSLEKPYSEPAPQGSSSTAPGHPANKCVGTRSHKRPNCKYLGS